MRIILAIKGKVTQPMQKFVFSLTNLPDIVNEAKSLNTKKAITFKKISQQNIFQNHLTFAAQPLIIILKKVFFPAN